MDLLILTTFALITTFSFSFLNSVNSLLFGFMFRLCLAISSSFVFVCSDVYKLGRVIDESEVDADLSLLKTLVLLLLAAVAATMPPKVI